MAISRDRIEVIFKVKVMPCPISVTKEKRASLRENKKVRTIKAIPIFDIHLDKL